MRNIIDREQATRVRTYSQNIGESTEYQIDFTRLMASRGTSIASVAWSSAEGDVSISGESLSSDKASADLSMTSAGSGLVKVSATQADGNVRVVYIAIRAIDPSGCSRDY